MSKLRAIQLNFYQVVCRQCVTIVYCTFKLWKLVYNVWKYSTFYIFRSV